MPQITPFDDQILAYMRAHGAERIGVFGSYARGEARPRASCLVQQATKPAWSDQDGEGVVRAYRGKDRPLDRTGYKSISHRQNP